MRRFYTLSCLLGCLSMCAQWEQVGDDGSCYGIAVHSDGRLFASYYSDTMVVSDDHGSTWTGAHNGIEQPGSWWVESIDGVLYTGGYTSTSFRSVDDGASWQDIGLSSARGFELHNDTLYACQWNGGVSWTMDQGTTWHPTAPVGGLGGLWPLFSFQGHLYIGRQGGGVYRLAHSAGSWEALNTGLPANPTVYAFAAIGNYLLCGGGVGIQRSSDAGLTWEAMDQTPLGEVYALLTLDSLVFAGLHGGGVAMSADSGATWAQLNTGLTNLVVARLSHDGNYLYAGTLGGGLHRFQFDDLNTSVAQVPHHTQLRVFPNPARGRVRVEWDGHRPVRYVLRSIDGALVQQGDLVANGINLDASHAGLYLLELQGADGSVRTVRLVRE